MYHYLPLFGVLRWVLESIELVMECEGEHMWYPVSSAFVLFGVLERMRYPVCV